MRSHRRFATIVLTTATVLAGASTMTLAGDEHAKIAEPERAFLAALHVVPGEAGPPSVLPTVTRMSYEVDVWDGMASGVLRQTIFNEGEEDLVVRVELSHPDEVEPTQLFLAMSGGFDELGFESQDDPPRADASGGATTGRRGVAAPARGRGRAGRNPEPAKRHQILTEPFEVPAEDSLEIATRFRTPVPLERGTFHLRLPAVGESPAAETVPLGISVTVHHGAPLRDGRSPSHDVIVDFVADRTVVEPVLTEFPGDRPFEFLFATQPEDAPTLAAYVRRVSDGEQGIEAHLDPPQAPRQSTVRPKQVLFIIDTSGSMKGEDKLDQARSAVATCVERLRPVDRFNIAEFDNDVTLMAKHPVDPAAYGVEAVNRWLAALRADGGTKLLPALETTLAQPPDTERHRILIVVTDGAIHDEKAALALLEEKLGESRLFVVGTGTHHRQDTLLRLAEYGRGAATFAGTAEALETAVAELFAAIADPIGWDLKIEWGGAQVEDITPSRLPDLYAGRPVRVHARVNGDAPMELAVRMKTLDGEQWFRVRLPDTRQPGWR